MNKLFKTLYFLTFLLIFHFGLCWVFTDYIKKNSILVEYQKDYESLKIPPKFLFVGDSHVMRSVYQSEIPGSFKLCHYGEGPILTYYRLKYLLETLGKKPMYIFIQADITRYSENYLKYSENHFFYANFVDYKELLEEDIIDTEQYIKYSSYRYFPYIELRSLIKKNRKAKMNRDYLKLEDIPENYRHIMANSFVQSKLLNFDCDKLFYPPALEYLKRTILLCQKHDVKVIAIKYPVTNYYMNSIVDLCGEQKIKSTAQDSLLSLYQIPIWDFENSFSNRYDLFFDSHHMNKAGRKTFTPLLKEHVIKLIGEELKPAVE